MPWIGSISPVPFSSVTPSELSREKENSDDNDESVAKTVPTRALNIESAMVFHKSV